MVQVNAGDHTPNWGKGSAEDSHVRTHVRSIPVRGEVEWVREDGRLPSLEGDVSLPKPCVLKFEKVWINRVWVWIWITCSSSSSSSSIADVEEEESWNNQERQTTKTRHWLRRVETANEMTGTHMLSVMKLNFGQCAFHISPCSLFINESIPLLLYWSFKYILLFYYSIVIYAVLLYCRSAE